jgi:hypothetical protein
MKMFHLHSSPIKQRCILYELNTFDSEYISVAGFCGKIFNQIPETVVLDQHTDCGIFKKFSGPAPSM